MQSGIKTAEMAVEAVRKDFMAIRSIPEELLTEKAYIIAVGKSGSVLRWVPDAAKTVTVCETAVSQDPLSLRWVPDAMKSEDMCVHAVGENINAMDFVPEELKTDSVYAELVAHGALDAVQKDWRALGHIPKDKRSRQICQAAVRKNGRALQWAPPEQATRGLCQDAVNQNGMALEFVPEKLRVDLAINAVRKNGLALQFVPAGARYRAKLCDAAVQSDGRALEFVPADVMTPSMCSQAAKRNMNALAFLPADKPWARTVCLEAARRSGAALRHMPESLRTEDFCVEAVTAPDSPKRVLDGIPGELATEKVCLAAVKQEWEALELVPEAAKTEAVCRCAVEKSWKAVRFLPPDAPFAAELCAGTAWRQAHDSPVGFLHAVPEKLLTAELCREAVKSQPMAIRHVPERFLTETICREAVFGAPMALEFVPDSMKTMELCLSAMRISHSSGSDRPLRFVPERFQAEIRQKLGIGIVHAKPQSAPAMLLSASGAAPAASSPAESQPAAPIPAEPKSVESKPAAESGKPENSPAPQDGMPKFRQASLAAQASGISLPLGTARACLGQWFNDSCDSVNETTLKCYARTIVKNLFVWIEKRGGPAVLDIEAVRGCYADMCADGRQATASSMRAGACRLLLWAEEKGVAARNAARSQSSAAPEDPVQAAPAASAAKPAAEAAAVPAGEASESPASETAGILYDAVLLYGRAREDAGGAEPARRPKSFIATEDMKRAFAGAGKITPRMCLYAAERNPEIMRILPDEALQDAAFAEEIAAKAVCSANPGQGALQLVPERYRTRNVCLKAVTADGASFPFVPDGVLDEDFCLEAVKTAKAPWRILKSMPAGLKTDAVCEAAGSACAADMGRMPEDDRSRICHDAILAGWKAMAILPDGFKTEDICLEAVRQDPAAISYVPEDRQTDAVLSSFFGEQEESGFRLGM